jgi:Lon protease-like protein
MPSPQILELEKTLQSYPLEDKQWLLQQLMQQLGLNPQEKPPVNYKQQAKNIIAETISEVLTLSSDCEEEVWQKFDLAKSRISEKLNEADLL